MRERPPMGPTTDLEAALRDLGTAIAYPPAEDLAAAVRIRVAAMPPPAAGLRERLISGRDLVGEWLSRPATRTARARRSATLAIALVALAGIIAVAGAAIIGLPGIRIVFGPGPSPTIAASPAVSATPGPSTTPGPTAPGPSPTATPLGADLGLGEPITGDPAEAAGFAPHEPTDAALGSPDVLYLQRAPAGRAINLVYGSRPGFPASAPGGVALIVTEFPGRVDEALFQKFIGGGVVVVAVPVGDGAGWWITGPPHEIFVVGANGQVLTERRRLAGDTLLWQRDGITYRIEGAPDLDSALRIAVSIP